mmetsp:Transcript_5621/g.8286  ORF Transcript_5621/g.8286 Transcript_5621/m.8286 type:complete len:123 (-) Transcript_5621:44-412(-)
MAFSVSPSNFNQIVIFFTAFVALVTVYELSHANRVAQILKGVSTTIHHAKMPSIQCLDPREDTEFKMYTFTGRNSENNYHTGSYFLHCKSPYTPTGKFRRGEITCWAGEWIWLTSPLQCEEK